MLADTSIWRSISTRSFWRTGAFGSALPSPRAGDAGVRGAGIRLLVHDPASRLYTTSRLRTASSALPRTGRHGHTPPPPPRSATDTGAAHHYTTTACGSAPRSRQHRPTPLPPARFRTSKHRPPPPFALEAQRSGSIVDLERPRLPGPRSPSSLAMIIFVSNLIRITVTRARDVGRWRRRFWRAL